MVRLLEKPGLLKEKTRRVVATTRAAAAGVLDPVEAERTVVLVAIRIKAVRPTVRPGVHRDIAAIAVEAAPEMGAAETSKVLRRLVAGATRPETASKVLLKEGQVVAAPVEEGTRAVQVPVVPAAEAGQEPRAGAGAADQVAAGSDRDPVHLLVGRPIGAVIAHMGARCGRASATAILRETDRAALEVALMMAKGIGVLVDPTVAHAHPEQVLGVEPTVVVVAAVVVAETPRRAISWRVGPGG